MRLFCKINMKVLVAVDQSTIAENAFEFYINNLHHSNNKVYVVHEAPQPNLPHAAYAHSSFFAEDIRDALHEHNKKLADLKFAYVKKCKKIKRLDYEVIAETTEESVGEAIINKATLLGAAVIVMGSRGHGTLRQTIFGSVSNYVMHHCNIPVVICHK